MSDYGIKVSQLDKSVFSTDAADVLMTSEYTLAKIDPTSTNTFTSIQFLFVTDPPANTDVKWYSIPYPYDYEAQMWQIWWDMELPPYNAIPVSPGYYVGFSSPNTILLWTRLNTTDQTLDFYFHKVDVGAAPSAVGLTGSYGNYIFVDDLTVT